jgi:hypothetical protein
MQAATKVDRHMNNSDNTTNLDNGDATNVDSTNVLARSLIPMMAVLGIIVIVGL